MHCLNCGCNRFTIELEEQEKAFIGPLDRFTADPSYMLIAACTFCGESFLKFPNESVRTAYEAYVRFEMKNVPAR